MRAIIALIFIDKIISRLFVSFLHDPLNRGKIDLVVSLVPSSIIVEIAQWKVFNSYENPFQSNILNNIF